MSVQYLTLLGCVALWAFGAGALSYNETAWLDFCKDYRVAFERVFTVPKEAAMLNCHLINKHAFDVPNTPYNVTWYDQRTGLEITGEEDGTIIKGASLWFLNSTMEHQGKYLCVVRTPEKCYKQAIVLQVSQPNSRECGRPQTAPQLLKMSVNDNLACPLRDYAEAVDRFSIQWYKGCELLQEGPTFGFMDKNLLLLIRDVSHNEAGLYTCRMTFVLGGVISEVAETIECVISEAVVWRPHMIEPTNEDINIAPGSQFKKQCRVFVHGKDTDHGVTVLWVLNNSFVSQNTLDRIHQTPQNETYVENGFWLESALLFSSVLQDDFNQNFTCVAFNYRESIFSYFRLQPANPDLLLPIGLLLTMLALLLMTGVFLYRAFKVELTLAFRTHCPFFYESTDGDGKVYDAYVVYPRFQGDTSSEAVEIFTLKMLPQVLEGRFGYRLFILGRDSLPGHAVVDVVEDTLSRCRQLLLLYTRTSLCRPEGVEWFERQAGMHRALVEGSLKVVLLELEEVTNPLSLPESVRLLREKQGAVEAWEKKRRWRCWPMCSNQRRTEKDSDLEKPLTFFTLPSRFWREVRYHMPVRGKAKPHSKRNLLLNV
ncbi:interleukin-1 receptor type 1 [Salminus brasiliensis]|uniref:interleukin-1 receptor type 1 n=1 Tax=Salminus brasiliensis TaxID=930266 RepID=UPI003B83721D